MKSMGNVLNGIHETLLGAVEDDDSEEHGYAKDAETVEKTCDVERAGTEAAVFEGFEDWGQWIDVYNPSIFLWGKAERVDDWGGVHEQLYAELYKEFQVPVFCGP